MGPSEGPFQCHSSPRILLRPSLELCHSLMSSCAQFYFLPTAVALHTSPAFTSCTITFISESASQEDQQGAVVGAKSGLGGRRKMRRRGLMVETPHWEMESRLPGPVIEVQLLELSPPVKRDGVPGGKCMSIRHLRNPREIISLKTTEWCDSC